MNTYLRAIRHEKRLQLKSSPARPPVEPMAPAAPIEPFPFLSLPGEIRHEIHLFAILGGAPHILPIYDTLTINPRIRPATPDLAPCALSFVSRQTYRESSYLYYRHTVFVARLAAPDSEDNLEQWLSMIREENRKAIRRLFVKKISVSDFSMTKAPWGSKRFYPSLDGTQLCSSHSLT